MKTLPCHALLTVKIAKKKTEQDKKRELQLKKPCSVSNTEGGFLIVNVEDSSGLETHVTAWSGSTDNA
jgi:predicted HTH transcriptional regulator